MYEYDYVQNFSAFQIPEPYEFSQDEHRVLFDLQRRKHLTSWDDKYKRAPLSDEERAVLADMERRIKNGTLIRAGGRELKFAPGQIHQVPRGLGEKIVAMNSERLRRLNWKQVRELEIEPTELHFETPDENRALTYIVGANEDEARGAAPTIEYKDGMVRFGDGGWMTMSST